jgi:nickel-dependent lactate racemase
MRIAIDCGRDTLEIDVPDDRLVAVRHSPSGPPLADPSAAVAAAVENPIGFPALRRALIPDDHVVVIVDEQLPAVGKLLMPVLEHISQAHVPPQAITLLCPPTSLTQPWLDDLSDAFQDTRLEVHNPSERKHLSYLAATRTGRRIYLNRTLVDADQVVLLTGRGYDPLLGYSGAEGAIYPAMGDDATRQHLAEHLSMGPPAKAPSALQREAAEVARLLGTPFMIQVIPGPGAEITHILGGPIETSGEGQRLLDERWRVEVDRPADTVIAALSGDPAGHTFDDLARAFACAARVVKPRGRIALVCAAQPDLGRAGALLRADNAGRVLDALRKQTSGEVAAVFQWASAAEQATLFLMSRLPAESAEEMFTVPLEHREQLQRLVTAGGTCLFLPDAHKTMAVLRAARIVAQMSRLRQNGFEI